jgi:multiple sugar transport system ATP-binding protein
MAEVTLRNVCKRYGDVTAVRDVSLTIRDKEFVVLVGPSGCGKSTTLRMIAGLEEISSGDLMIGQRRVNDVAPKDRDIAMVFQSYALYPHMSVRENLAFGLKLRKTPKPEIDRRVNEVAELLAIGEYLERKPKQLSGGQRQRVAMGRALVREPQVFLFDEPLSNLDAKLRSQMRAEIARLHHRHPTTVVYVTHDQVEAMTLADRIVVMKDGIIQQEGPPLELYGRPANLFVAGFLGNPPMNLLKARLDAVNPEIALGQCVMHIPDEHAKVVRTALLSHSGGSAGQSGGAAAVEPQLLLGVRPEDVSLLPGDPSGPGVNGGARLSGRVEVVEPMGSEVIVHVATDVGPVVARVPPVAPPRVGEGITVSFNSRRVHLFDARTERRLG